MADRLATPEEVAAFRDAMANRRGGVPANFPVPQGEGVAKFEDPGVAPNGEKPIRTETPVMEPGGKQVTEDRLATPEEAAAFHAAQTPKATPSAPPAPPNKSSLADLRHEFYRGVIPLPESAINATEAYANAHDPFSPHGTYDEELVKVQDREENIKREHPWLSTGVRVLGAVAPGSALIKGGTNALQAATGVSNLATRLGGAALGAGVQGGAQEGPLGAALGAAGGAGGQLLGEGLGAIARRFPWVADRLAERMTGQTAKQSAARIMGTAKGNFPEGDYANAVNEMGLNRLTPGGAVDAGVEQAKIAGDKLKVMRAGLSATPQELEQAIGNHPALDDLREALQLGKGGGSTVDGLPVSNLPPELLARNPQLAQAVRAGGANVDLDKLAEETLQNVTNPLNKLSLQAADPRFPPVSQSAMRALQKAKDALNTLQDTKILAKGVNPGEYDAARKAYAIASGVTRGEAKTAGQLAVRKGIGATVGLVAGHPFVGAAVGDRPAAYAALKLYQASRTAPAQMLAKAIKSGTPAVAAAATRAKLSDQPSQAGAAIQKAQANDPKAREPENGEGG